jgi:hypothetical protein
MNQVMVNETDILKNNKNVFLIIILMSFFIVNKYTFAIPAMQQRCEPNKECIIGEYIFADDGFTPVTTTNFCQITITDPNDTVIVNNQNLLNKSDGWHYYSTTTLNSPEGLYRSVICCDSGANRRCIDKTFILGTSFETLPEKIWSYANRTLTNFGTLVADIWSYSNRTLTSLGSIAADIWNDTFAPIRKLTSRQIGTSTEYIAGVTTSTPVSQVASSNEVQQIKNDIINEINANEAKIDNIYADTQYIRGKVDNILAKWGSYSASDLINELTTIKSLIGTSTDASSTETIFGRTKYLQEKWGIQTAQTIFDKAEAARALIAEVQNELGYHGTSTTAYADLQLVKSYTDDLETLVGQPSDNSTANTLFGRIKGVKEGTDKLINNLIVAEATVNDTNASSTSFITNLIQTSNNFYNGNILVFTSGANAGQVRRIIDYDGASKKITVDPALSQAPTNGDTFSILSQTAVAGIDAQTIWTYGTRTLTSPNLDSGSLATLQDLKHWTVYLSDVGQVLAGKTYRAKLYILNYLSAPTDPYATPTVTVYDAARNKVVENVLMTKISTGIYEYTYNIPSSSNPGLWETEASVEVESGKIIKANDYWEVEASPPRVIINSITDNTIPSITANVTISNEGTSGYEYQYEYCIVDSLENKCGGGDDIDYVKAAEYINAGEDWNTNLTSTVSNVGTYYFKVVVYWGTERSVAIRQFNAIQTPITPPPSGGGGYVSTTTTPTLACKGPDLNFDDIVNSIDFSILLYYWKQKPPFKNPCTDINKDNKVDSIDFSIMLYWWNKKYD